MSRARRVILRAGMWFGIALVAIALILFAEVLFARRAPRLDGFGSAQLDGLIGPAKGIAHGAPADEPLRVVWLGDSTGAGVGSSNPEHALPRVVASGMVAAGRARAVDLHVLAVSGARAPDVLRAQVPRLAVLRPQWVFIGVGATDVVPLSGRPVFRARLDAILNAVYALKPDVVVLVGIGEYGTTTLLAQPLRAIAAWRAHQFGNDIRSAARRNGALYVDIAGETGPSFGSDPDRYLARDHYHPSDAGYELWADAVLRALDGLTQRPSR